MNNKNLKKLRQQSLDELKKSASEAQMSLAKVRVGRSQEKSKDTNLYKKEKRDLARILTIVKEKEFLGTLKKEEKSEDV